MSNSSISRRAPGSPSPSPLPDAEPWSRAASMSRMPGPASCATTRRPYRPSSYIGSSRISPLPTWTTMLRAISEIAVAMSVASVLEKPSFVARARPSARAGTMSESEVMGTRISSPILGVPPHLSVEPRERLVEIERRVERLEVQLELHHRDRDVGLDPDDHGLRAAEPGGDRDRAERAGDEGVDDVQCPDVDDEPARTLAADPLGQLVAEGEDLAVAEAKLQRSDQIVALAKDRDRGLNAQASASSSEPAGSLAR